MKLFDKRQNQIGNHLPAVDQKQTESRRSILQKMLASCAVFATGLVVSKRAEASCWCHGHGSCHPHSETQCIVIRGLCWDPDLLQYRYELEIHWGVPHMGCCVNAYALECPHLCSDEYPC